MKNQFEIFEKYFAIFLLLSTLFVLPSCNEDSKLINDIIGEYYLSYNFEIEDDIPEDMSMLCNVESYEEFFAGKNVKENIKLQYLITYDGGSFTINYELIVFGTWNIENSILYYNYDIEDILVSYVNTNASDNSEKGFVEEFNSAVNEMMLPIFKQSFIEAENSPSTIQEISERSLITVDIDGEEIIQKRLK